MKTTKKVKMKAALALDPKRIDQLAAEYLELNGTLKQGGALLAEQKAEIKNLADKFGVTNSTLGIKIVCGNKYQVGFKSVTRAGALDPALVKQNVKIWRQCQSLQFDPSLFEALVKAGKTPTEEILACFAPDQPTQRILVEPLSGKASNEADPE